MNRLSQIAKRKEDNYQHTLNKDELRSLILRVTGNEKYADLFDFIKIEPTSTGFDEYRMYDAENKIVIEATSGVAAASAFNKYLKEYCNSYYGPLTKNINLPDTPPHIDGTISDKSVFLYRYFMNYCTFGYSFLFSDWEEYEKLTDWMMLSGINLALNIVGHEIVWRDLLSDLGYSEEDINNFICGPSYLPWQWMGNTTKNGGNLSESWYERRKELGNRINNKLRAFGAEVMVPGYFGMVPNDFKDKFPESNPFDQGGWCDASYRPAILSDKDIMFDKMSDLFYKNMKKHFGDFYYFSGDPFHEGGKMNGINLTEYGANIIKSMKKAYPTGVWALQGWGDNPRKELLEKMEKQDIIILDLMSDKNLGLPKCYEEYPWIFSTTSNFGGTRIIDGDVRCLLEEPYNELEKDNSYMVGIGMTMEAVATDEIIFEALSENAIKANKTSLEDFVNKYVAYRYNSDNSDANKSIQIIAEKILRADLELRKFSGRESGLCARPSLDADRVSTCAGSLKISYNENDLVEALRLLYNAYDELHTNECYRFDLMDVARQTISNKSWHYLSAIKDAYDSFDMESFVCNTEKFLNLFDIQEKLLSTSKHTMLGTWLKQAQDYAQTKAEAKEFKFIAKNLITLWSEKDCSVQLRDYAYKEWSGMMMFYKERWSVYFNMLELYFARRDEMPEIDWKEFDFCFVLSDKEYPTEPTSDLKSAVLMALEENIR